MTRTEMIQMLLDRVQSQNAALGSGAGTALSGAGTALSDSDRELLLRNRIPQSILGKLTGGIITPSFESVVKNTLRNLSDSDREMLLRKKAKQKKRKKQ